MANEIQAREHQDKPGESGRPREYSPCVAKGRVWPQHRFIRADGRCSHCHAHPNEVRIRMDLQAEGMPRNESEMLEQAARMMADGDMAEAEPVVSMERKFSVKLPPYQRHPKQLELIRSKLKRKMVKAGRRGGKTTGAMILAVMYFSRGLRVRYAAPTSDQTDRFWSLVKEALEEPLANGTWYKNETTRVIEPMGSTRQQIRAMTAWNVDNLRGDSCDLLILEEYQMMAENAWEVVCQPMLMDYNGDALLIFTPPSQQQQATKAIDKLHASKLFKKNANDPEWLCLHFRSMDNPFLSEEGLAEAARGMSALAYRQEILAEDVEEVPGALWTRELVERTRVRAGERLPDMRRVVVGVDPSGSNTADTETGCVACGEGTNGHFYVLRDRSDKGTPTQWAERAVRLYHDVGADRLVAEKNFGGDMVQSTIQNVDENVSYKGVTASRGKVVRAQPICYLFEDGRAHIVGEWPELEEQMCVALGTMIQTSAGERRIESLKPGDLVLTRFGPQPIVWSGPTGIQPTFKIKAGGRVLECSANHPIFALDRGFSRADTLRADDRVLKCQSRSNGHLSYFAASDIFSPTTAITEPADRAVGGFTIGTNLKNFADRFRAAGTFITMMRTEPTIGFGIYGLSLPQLTTEFTDLAARQLNPQKSGAQSAKRNGWFASRMKRFVQNAKTSSGPRAIERSTVVVDAEIVHITESIPSGTSKPLWNIHVAGAHEYFANGILTHNCTYVPGDASPDRLDAMVWAMTELSGSGSLGLIDLFKSGRAERVMGRVPIAMTPVAPSRPSSGSEGTWTSYRNELPSTEARNLDAATSATSLAAVMTNDKTPKCPNCQQVTLQNTIAGGQIRCGHCGMQRWQEGQAPQGVPIGARRDMDLMK